MNSQRVRLGKEGGRRNVLAFLWSADIFEHLCRWVRAGLVSETDGSNSDPL